MAELALATDLSAPVPDTPAEFDKYDGLAKAPVDRYGIPFLIHPFDESHLGKLQKKFRHEDPRSDEDHAFYCHDQPELGRETAGTGGLGVRVSRAQTANRLLHAGKHYAFPGGLERYPANTDEQFATLVLLGGGYLSRRAWDFRDPDNPAQITFSKRNYREMRNDGTVHLVFHPDKNSGCKTTNFSRAIIGMFFAEYARAQNLTFLNERTIDCFLNTTSEGRRRKVGKSIIYQAIQQVGERIDPIYQEAFEEQGTKPHPNLTEASTVVRSFFYRNRWPQYFDAFENELRRQLGLTPKVTEGIITPVTN